MIEYLGFQIVCKLSIPTQNRLIWNLQGFNFLMRILDLVPEKKFKDTWEGFYSSKTRLKKQAD